MRLPPNFGRHLVIVLALLGAGFFGAYLRFLPYLEQEATYTDGRRSLELSDVDRLRFAVWDDPAPLSPVVNTEGEEGRPTVSPDGRLLVFAVGARSLNADLWVAHLEDGEPRDPRPLSAVNTAADELAPAFTADALYFASNRAGGEGGLDLFRIPYEDGVFGAPERLGPDVNSPAEDTDPVVVPGSEALAFASNRSRGARTDYDLWTAVPPGASMDFGESDAPDTQVVDEGGEPAEPADAPPLRDPDEWSVLPLDELNTPFDEREPAFTADGLGLLFASDRDGALGGFDLWRSVQAAGRWLPAEPLVGINDTHDQRAPWPSADGFTLLYAVDDGRGSDLYRARSVELFRMPGRPLGWLDLTILGLLLLVALLAWLGKRWEALDILYKCLLVSLVVHVGLMLWFREVPIEHETVELPEGTSTFQVSLAPTREALAANQERGGQLEVARGETAAMSAPARHDTQASVQGSDAGREAQPTAAGALPQPATASADAPGKATDALARSTSTPEAAVELQDHIEASGAKQQSEAPAMTLVAAAVPAARQSSTAAPAPTRAQASSTASRPSTAASSPAPAQLTMPERTTGPAMPGPRTAVDPSARQAQAVNTPQVAVAGPTMPLEAPATAQAAPAEMALDDLVLAASPAPMRVTSSRPTRAPSASSASTASRQSPSTTPTSAALTAPTVATSSAPTSSPTSVSEMTSRSSRPTPDIALAESSGSPASTDRPADPTAVPGTPLGAPMATSLVGAPAAMATPSRVAAQVPGPPTRWTTSSTRAAPVDAPPTYKPLTTIVAAATTLPDRPASEWEHTPYRTRFGDAKVQALEEFGGTAETEKAVASGLAYLARVQRRGGYWGSADNFDDKYGHVAVGKTALCLLAFLGAGHTPISQTEHTRVAERAVAFLTSVQDEETGHFGYSTSYSHGVTTYALAECYALTKDESLRVPLEKAIAWILGNQSRSRDRRNFGGWGYYYPDGRIYDPWSRASITTWQIMALESARLGGMTVPDRAFADAATFLRNSHREDEGILLYNHDPERLNAVFWTLPGSTPAGLFALSLLGEDLTSSTYRTTIRYVRERAPRRYADDGNEAFIERATGNLYFWYYGSLTLLRHGGKPWIEWNRHLQDTLLPIQGPDGSWEPISPYAEYAGDTPADRSYSTAMCVLTLEVYYRYFTPLLKVH